MSIEIQYTIVGIILIVALIWGGIAMRRTVRGKRSCCGCSLKDSCCNNAANKKNTCCGKKNTANKKDTCCDKKNGPADKTRDCCKSKKNL